MIWSSLMSGLLVEKKVSACRCRPRTRRCPDARTGSQSKSCGPDPSQLAFATTNEQTKLRQCRSYPHLAKKRAETGGKCSCAPISRNTGLYSNEESNFRCLVLQWRQSCKFRSTADSDELSGWLGEARNRTHPCANSCIRNHRKRSASSLHLGLSPRHPSSS